MTLGGHTVARERLSQFVPEMLKRRFGPRATEPADASRKRTGTIQHQVECGGTQPFARSNGGRDPACGQFGEGAEEVQRHVVARGLQPAALWAVRCTQCVDGFHHASAGAVVGHEAEEDVVYDGLAGAEQILVHACSLVLHAAATACARASRWTGNAEATSCPLGKSTLLADRHRCNRNRKRSARDTAAAASSKARSR